MGVTSFAGRSAPLRAEPLYGVSGLRRAAANATLLERCDYCGCSRHACGCEDRFAYEDIRDNPTLFAR